MLKVGYELKDYDGASLVAQSVKICNAGDTGSVPGSGKSPGEENGNPFQDSCLKNPMDQGAWWTIVHGVTKSDLHHCIRNKWINVNKCFAEFHELL